MRVGSIAVLIALVAGPWPAQAQAFLSLEHLAQQDGYTMQWLGPERSVCLSRAGTTIVLRPGSVLYDVNSHVETADAAPVATASGDLLVSTRVARRLAALATVAPRDRVAPGRAPTAAAASGTIVVIARELGGAHALFVEGSAPQNARVTLTVLAQLAPELPTVLLERRDAQTDVYGRFSAVVTLASDFMPGSLVTVLATGDGLNSGSTHLRLDGTL